jgi:limonene-1,2-epoxide hydrolase
VYGGDVEKKDAVLARSWTYLQRAHLHGGAIGTAALASILALALVCRAGMLANLSALAFGLGAILYPLFWLMAAFRAPELGGTGRPRSRCSGWPCRARGSPSRARWARCCASCRRDSDQRVAAGERDPLQRFPLYLIEAREPEGPVYLLTFLTLEELEAVGGLHPHAIVGKVFDPAAGIVPDNFARNRALSTSCAVIRQAVPTILEYIVAASEAGDGQILVLDERAAHAGRTDAVPDVIGTFEVEGGRIVPDSYAPAADHWILTEDGIFTPHPAIQDALLAALRAPVR